MDCHHQMPRNILSILVMARKYTLYMYKYYDNYSVLNDPDGLHCCNPPFTDANNLRTQSCVTILAIAEGTLAQISLPQLTQIAGGSSNVYDNTTYTQIAARINNSQ
jgi:hypothetical protein